MRIATIKVHQPQGLIDCELHLVADREGRLRIGTLLDGDEHIELTDHPAQADADVARDYVRRVYGHPVLHLEMEGE